ncbi:hypothetical protein D6745_03675 [Candidatus Woesearchaeota archaeon]|nr:MAG: hypothetical protein D6745_03675 [Candidatus Woesearchaeota archaeon]
MFVDIVFPQKNEKEFLSMAEKLGSKLCFVYPKEESYEKEFSGIITTQSQITKLKQKANLLVVRAGEENRKAFDAGPDIIFGLENSKRPDFIHQRNSGLNQVLCNLAKKHGTMIGISFADFLRAEKPAQYLGRVMQNIMLCQKYNVEMVVASFARTPYEMRPEHELKSFCLMLGMHQKTAKEAINNLHKKIMINQKKKRKEYYNEEIYVEEN